MALADDRVFISLNPPYRMTSEAEPFLFTGWAEVSDPAAPNIVLTLNGVDIPMETFERPGLQTHFPGLVGLGIRASVNLKDILGGLPSAQVPEPFLLEATVTSDHRVRTFEYEAADIWLRRVFGRKVKARAIPPEKLQIRVAGAAAGEYHRTGRKVADQIEAVLAAHGRPLATHRRILDFGCGPGRVTDCIHDRHPGADLSGCDIDPEAIAWANRELGDVASFHVNKTEPPLPFEDETFDLVYGISVFTHLPENLQWAWFSELRRVVKPGGLVLTTKLNPAAYDLPEAIKQLGQDPGFAYWGDAAATAGLPGFYRLAYHSHDYVRREWGRYFQVLHVGAHDLNRTQDAVLLQRPRHALSWLPPRWRKRLHGLLRGAA